MGVLLHASKKLSWTKNTANKATPKISPQILGIPSALSKKPELHCAIVHSAAPPKKIANTQSQSVLFLKNENSPTLKAMFDELKNNDS